jgi:filamentous hemagglutinin family protein
MTTGLAKLLIAAPVLAVFSVVGAVSSPAQVTLDGSANPNFKGPAPFEAGSYDLRAELGRRAGPNLFHSFGKFSLRTGERATFSGPDRIERIISRVTGGARSDIDGTIASTIPGADFYFLNPAGVVFGPNARLDLKGSFHVSTADELRFADGAAFAADPAASSFTVAAPEAFGFLGASPAPILVDQSVLEVPTGKAFSIVGGNIDIVGGPDGFIRAEAGQITLAAVGGPGQAQLDSGAIDAVRKADISLVDRAWVETSGDGGGTIRIRGGKVVAEGIVQVFADNNGNRDSSGGLDLNAHVLRLQNRSLLTADVVEQGTGTGGRVRVRTDTLQISDDSFLAADTFAEGNAGKIIVVTGKLSIDGAGIRSDVREGSSGNAGTVTVRANTMILSNFGSVSSDTSTEGNAGAITVRADDLILRNAGFISSDTLFGAEGNAGTVVVRADDMVLADGHIRSNAFFEAEGDAGTVMVGAGNLILRNGSSITSDTSLLSEGDAGTVTVRASDLVLRDGSFVSSTTQFGARGDAGAVTVRADRIRMHDGSFISSAGRGEGAAGAVTVQAGELLLHDDSLITSAISFGDRDAGPMTVRANSLVLDHSRITSTAAGGGAAGPVTVSAGELIISDFGNISSSTFGEGNAGSVTVRAGDLLLQDFGGISSDTFDQGAAGTVTVRAANVFLQDDGRITSSARFGAEGGAGAVTVEAAQLRIEGGEFFTGIASRAEQNTVGNAGTLVVRAGRLTIGSEGAISSESLGRGTAGAVLVEGHGLRINGGRISTNSAEGGGGEIRLKVGDVIVFQNDSAVTTSVAGGADATAGNITIDPRILVIDGSVIKADSGGFGGRVMIVADNILVPGGDFEALIRRGDVSASGGTPERAGTIAVDSPEVDLSAGLVLLEGALLDAASQLRARCGARRDVGASSFTGVGRGGLPPSPDGPLAGAYLLDEGAVRGIGAKAELRPAAGTAPADVRLAGLIAPCAPLD